MAIRKNKKRIDPRYFLSETTHRDLEEQEGQDAVKALLEKLWNSIDRGIPQISAELGMYGGEGCRQPNVQAVIDKYEKIMGEVNNAADSIKDAQTMVHQLRAAVKAGRSDVSQVLRYYSELVNDATAAYEAAKAMNPEDQRSIKKAISAACGYDTTISFHRRDPKGIKGMIERALGV